MVCYACFGVVCNAFSLTLCDCCLHDLLLACLNGVYLDLDVCVFRYDWLNALGLVSFVAVSLIGWVCV